MKLTHAALALGAVGMVYGCGGKDQSGTAESVKKGASNLAPLTQANIFPMETGNEWTYELSGRSLQGSGKAEAVFKMTKVEDLPDGGKRATIEIDLDGKLSERQTWELNKDGLYQTAGGQGLVPFSPPQPAFLFGAPKNPAGKQAFHWNGKGPMPVGEAGQASLDNTFIGPELVDTATGPMWGWAIETTGHFTVSLRQTGKPPQDAQAVEVTDSWWQPNVGFIRSKTKVNVPGVQENEQTLILKKFSPVTKK